MTGTANAAAVTEGREEFSVDLPGGAYVQRPQKYHAKSLAALREKFAAVRGDAKLTEILEAAGCAAYLS